ncbi:hypothetical protein CYLTODRAFT_487597 [Cylindrobasidium torrendii FP15055 ss-10]|uniref:Uncharacterized protein n=1 Tax=Cylindrobasidium torrendii FP15055 ss-10 TaxID=1314674 RepID=A0A0D7BKF2_9AGAR|nr:hypothetical protein CYLTODRAFT_487597 [Cylindrobasidium torrendii FP15055 ss-10]
METTQTYILHEAFFPTELKFIVFEYLKQLCIDDDQDYFSSLCLAWPEILPLVREYRFSSVTVWNSEEIELQESISTASHRRCAARFVDIVKNAPRGHDVASFVQTLVVDPHFSDGQKWRRHPSVFTSPALCDLLHALPNLDAVELVRLRWDSMPDDAWRNLTKALFSIPRLTLTLNDLRVGHYVELAALLDMLKPVPTVMLSCIQVQYAHGPMFAHPALVACSFPNITCMALQADWITGANGYVSPSFYPKLESLVVLPGSTRNVYVSGVHSIVSRVRSDLPHLNLAYIDYMICNDGPFAPHGHWAELLLPAELSVFQACISLRRPRSELEELSMVHCYTNSLRHRIQASRIPLEKVHLKLLMVPRSKRQRRVLGNKELLEKISALDGLLASMENTDIVLEGWPCKGDPVDKTEKTLWTLFPALKERMESPGGGVELFWNGFW